MRSVRLLALSLAAAALSATPAGAISSGAHTDLVGAATVSESITTTNDVSRPSVASLNGHCTYARHAVGLEGEGVNFTVAGVANTSGTYYGIPIVATGIKCELVKPDMTITAGPENYPGLAAATNRTESSLDARGGAICVEVFALLNRPAPDGRTLVSSGRKCH